MVILASDGRHTHRTMPENDKIIMKMYDIRTGGIE